MGPYLTKLRGAGQGSGPLVAEIIVAELATALGLSVPQRALISLPAKIETADWDDELDELLVASVGVNLGFQYLDDAHEIVPGEIEQIAREIRAAVLWLDRLVLNPDRIARNPNLLWCRGQPWLIDHGASLGFQYNWPGVTEDSPRNASLMPHAHLFEAQVSEAEIREVDARLAPLLSREVIDAAVAQVPDVFLAPLLSTPRPSAPIMDETKRIQRRRAAYSAFLRKRLREPRPFLAQRTLPPDLPLRGNLPSWLTKRQ